MLTQRQTEGGRAPCFFLQAEDGIRDIGVTGVQTCALPISRARTTSASRSACTRHRHRQSSGRSQAAHQRIAVPAEPSRVTARWRAWCICTASPTDGGQLRNWTRKSSSRCFRSPMRPRCRRAAASASGGLPTAVRVPPRTRTRPLRSPAMGGRAAPAAGLRLPAERSSFVGRRAELARLRGLLAESRLVTLVGPGGVGKTRLALRVADELRRSFPDGVTLADLTAVRDPALAAAQVAAAFDVRDSTGRWLPASLADVLGERRVLLVLDNCEHLRDACAVLLDALTPACPGLSVLATSRTPLDLPGEALLAVPPLPVGAGSEAVALLGQRARAAAPDLVLTPADDGTLAELCRRLDGIPLAIELAAVRLRTLPPAELLDRLGDG